MIKKLGLLLKNLLPSDYIFGSYSPIRHDDIINPDGDWFNEFPPHESQMVKYSDTWGCVSFSALNVLEAKFNYFIKHKLFSEENIQWLRDKGYLNENDEMNCSDWFIVLMSGTRPYKGNFVRTVWETMRKTSGLIPQHMTPNGLNTVDKYYDKSNITQEMKDLGKEFLERFKIFYEYVPTDDLEKLKEVFKYSALQVLIALCPKKNGIHQRCDRKIIHAVSLPRIKEDLDYLELFDQYSLNGNYIRKVSKDYLTYKWAVACYIKELNKKNIMEFKKNELILILTKHSQYLGMELDGRIVVYKNNFDASNNASARREEKHLLAPEKTVRLEDLKGVEIVDGKGDKIELE
jgi:hypothetical protein